MSYGHYFKFLLRTTCNLLIFLKKLERKKKKVYNFSKTCQLPLGGHRIWP